MDASRQETCALMGSYSCYGKTDRGWSAFAFVRAQAHVVLLKLTWISAHVYCSKLSNCLYLFHRSTGSTSCAAAQSGSSLQDNVQFSLPDEKCHLICIDKCLMEPGSTLDATIFVNITWIIASLAGKTSLRTCAF